MNTIFQRFGAVFLLTFVNALSFTMLFPVLPFIVRSYDQPEFVLGILLGTFSFFQFIVAPILGALSDKYGRKPILLITQAGTFLSWVVLGVAYILPSSEIFGLVILPIFMVFLSRMFDGITGANQSVATAMLADMTSREERSQVFGYNGAIFGFSLLVGPALGSLSLSLGYGYLGTAITGGIISLITLGVMVFMIQESLSDQKKKSQAQIRFREFNIISQVKKWGSIEIIQYVLWMKVFMFIGFVTYTSISALYMIDVFGFSAENVGYFLTFTGSFLILHQSFSIRIILQKLGDDVGLIIGMILMVFGFSGMGLSGEKIVFFTVLYFFSVLGISLTFTTTAALISKSIDETHQGEIMGMSASIESLISIGTPILATFLYTFFSFSIFYFAALLPLLGLGVTAIFYRKTCFVK